MQMNKFFGLFLLLLINAVFLCDLIAEESIDYYSPENTLKFADYLFAQGDYLRAVGEYQRYMFIQPKDNEMIRYKIAVCYRLGGKNEHAIQAFRKLLNESSDSKAVSAACYQIGVSYFLMQQYSESVSFLDTSLPLMSDDQFRIESQQLIGLSYLMNRDWSSAKKIFNELKETDILEARQKAIVYSEYANNGANLPNRSPILAGFLSTIVPGAGRLYTGRFGDAVTSIITVGITGWQAYDGFSKDGLSSAKGWTLGTLCAIFYAGNIYGSVISAKVYNRHVADEFLTTLSIEFPY